MALHVEFFTQPVLHPAMTREKGRPIYEDREMVKIMIPGDKRRTVVAPAEEYSFDSERGGQFTYIERFPDHYKAFKETGENLIEGTPLSMLKLTPAKVAEFNGMHIRTIEQLAEISDRDIAKMGMGAREFVEQAKAYIGSSASAVELRQVQDELAALKAQMAGDTKAKAKPAADIYADFEDDDLRNMIADAGGDTPSKSAKRVDLIKALDELQKKVA